MSRVGGAVAVLLWLMLAGDAALGDRRPVFERQWKGAAAVLLALAGAIHLWQRYRLRTGSADEPRAEPAPPAVTHAVRMPPLGDGVLEGTVTSWLKQIGDRVEAGEPLLGVSIDKVDIEIPAATSGDLREIKVPAGATASVGSTLAVIVPF